MDQRCVKYCMLYHQSEQMKNSDRITALDKIEDIYNYENLSYPVSFEDEQKIEELTKITINVYRMDGETNIVSQQDGNVWFHKNGMVNLLYVEDENEEQGH